MSGRKEASRTGKGRKEGDARNQRKAGTRKAAAGAELGGTKGNQQKSQVREAEGKHGKPGGAEVESQGSESGDDGTGKAAVRQNREERNGRTGKLSSRKRNGNRRKKVDGKRKRPKPGG